MIERRKEFFMKNKIKVLAACLALGCLVLSGCGEDTTPDPKQGGKAAAYESHLKEITPAAYGNVQGLKLPKKKIGRASCRERV